MVEIQKEAGADCGRLKGLTEDVCDGLFWVLEVVVATQIFRRQSPQERISRSACDAGCLGEVSAGVAEFRDLTLSQARCSWGNEGGGV